MNQELIDNGLSRRQLEISNTIRRLWMEHVLWTRLFIISAVFNLPDLSFVTQRLLQNPIDFARVLQPLYGKQTAMQFKELLTDHLLIAARLVDAAKAVDNTEAANQREIWFDNAEEIAKFLASINPFWNEHTWKRLLFEHLRFTENEAVYILTGQYERSIREYDAIQAEALQMADVMTNGIIRQFRIK